MSESPPKLTTLSELKARFLKDPTFRAAYEEADAEYRLIEEEIRARLGKPAK